MQNICGNMNVFKRIFGRKTQAPAAGVLYTPHTLETIPLCDFIDVFFGDVSKVLKSGVCSQKVCADIAEMLVNQYTEIIGGKNALIELANRDKLVRLEMRVAALQAVISLCEVQDAKNAAKVMTALGVKTSEKAKVETILQKARGLLLRDKLQMKMLHTAAKKKKEGEKAMTREDFTKERVAVMRATKLHIDPRQYTAAEYAYLVAGLAKEYEETKRETERIKSKRK